MDSKVTTRDTSKLPYPNAPRLPEKAQDESKFKEYLGKGADWIVRETPRAADLLVKVGLSQSKATLFARLAAGLVGILRR